MNINLKDIREEALKAATIRAKTNISAIERFIKERADKGNFEYTFTLPSNVIVTGAWKKFEQELKTSGFDVKINHQSNGDVDIYTVSWY